MSTATEPVPTPAHPAESPDDPFWPVTVAMYTEMIRHGIIGEKEPVYLWNGRLATKMGASRTHTLAVQNMYDSLVGLRIEGHQPEMEASMSLRFGPSVPEPDVKIVRGRSRDYRENFPTAADVPLVVEVSDSALAIDRKLAFTYAVEGIPIYWLLNIPGRFLEVFSEPAEGAYSRCTLFGPDDEIPVILDGREVGRIRVKDLLP